MSGSDICWLCERPITGSISAKEHIIPNSIGGKRTLAGFLCSVCNQSTGETWDAELAKQLNYFGLLFETRRQRGAVPSMKANTATGGLVEIQAGNRPVIGRPTFRETCDKRGVRINISARSRQEVRKMLRGLGRKYPQIDVDKVLDEIEESEVYSNDPIGIDFDVSGPNAKRSIVKAAVALACEAGLKPEDCDLAMEYLKNEENEYDADGFWDYYQEDIIKNRTIGLPLHCVYITGSPTSGLLLAYVEYYGVVRRVICLSRGYSGEPIGRMYSVNPVDGQELGNVAVGLDDAMFDVVKAQTPEGLVAGLMKATNQIMSSGMRLSRCRTIARLGMRCMREYCEKNGLVIEQGDRQDLEEEVAQRLMPLIEYYSTPMEFPEGFDPNKVTLGGD